MTGGILKDNIFVLQLVLLSTEYLIWEVGQAVCILDDVLLPKNTSSATHLQQWLGGELPLLLPHLLRYVRSLL